jgi:hypothetical protein
MLSETGEGGKHCLAGMRDLFRRPGFTAQSPKVEAVTVHGGRAAAVISNGYQRRELILRRVNGVWRITGASELRR